MEKTDKKKYPAKTHTTCVFDAFVETSNEEKSDNSKTEQNPITIEEINAVISRYNRHISEYNQKFGEWV